MDQIQQGNNVADEAHGEQPVPTTETGSFVINKLLDNLPTLGALAVAFAAAAGNVESLVMSGKY